MPERERRYQQIIQWVEEEISSGRLQYGDKMMSEKELCEKFGLSRQTVRHATGELMKRHLITRIQGSGTYIGGSHQLVRKEKHMSVAVVSTFSETYIFPPTLRGIENVLSKAGYSMQVSFTDNKIDQEAEILQALLQKDHIDGLIIEPSKSALPNPNLHYYKELMDRHIPVLFFNAVYPELSLPCVRIDDQSIGRKATELLIQAGHSKIGGIFQADDRQGKLRYAGYLDAMLVHHLQLDPKSVVWIDTVATQHLDQMADYLFRRLSGCTGVFCYNDEVAVQVIEQADQRGILVPDALSIVGIDNSNLAEICRTPFTSFPHPKELLGRKAAENMLQMIDYPEFDGNYLFDTEPVLRGSVRQIPQTDL